MKYIYNWSVELCSTSRIILYPKLYLKPIPFVALKNTYTTAFFCHRAECGKGCVVFSFRPSRWTQSEPQRAERGGHRPGWSFCKTWGQTLSCLSMIQNLAAQWTEVIKPMWFLNSQGQSDFCTMSCCWLFCILHTCCTSPQRAGSRPILASVAGQAQERCLATVDQRQIDTQSATQAKAKCKRSFILLSLLIIVVNKKTILFSARAIWPVYECKGVLI